MDIKQYLEELPFYEKLTREQQERLLQTVNRKDYSQGSILHDHSSECLGMVILLRGKLRAYMVSEDGREITLYRMEEGDVDVLTASCVINQLTFETQMVADTEAQILVLPAVVIAAMKEEVPVLDKFIYEMAAERFSDVMWTMQQILFKRIDERIAGFLYEEYGKNGRDPVLHVTQEEIAKNINSAREVVARMLKRFQEEGVLSVHRGRITLKDMGYIQNLALHGTTV